MTGEEYVFWKKRRRIAMDVVSECGNITMVAELWGISRVATREHIKKRWPSIYQALLQGRRRQQLHPHRVLHRLRVLSTAKNQTQAAKIIGISNPAMVQFVRKYAPDGIQEALELYEANYGAPLLEAAA